MENTLTLLLSIINRFPNESPNYKIADYLLHHLGEINHMTTGLLAQQCHVSKSAVSRFCRLIGLEDFLDLQIMIRSGQHSFHHLQYETYADVDFINHIQQDLHSLPQLHIHSIVNDLHRYQSIYVMGHLQSSLPAYNLQYHLAQVGKLIRCYDSIVEQKRILIHSTCDDLIIIFTHSGKFFDRIMVRPSQLKSCQAKIYVISMMTPNKIPPYIDNWISCLASNNMIAPIIFTTLTQMIAMTYCQTFLNVSKIETTDIYEK